MKAYRLEMGGSGPYNNTFRGMSDEEYDTIDELNMEHSCQDTHKGWQAAFSSLDYVEMTRGDNTYILSAFESNSDLELWFDGFLSSLLDIGFEIQTYEVSDESVFFSKSGLSQIAFDCSYATLLERELV